MRKRRILIGAVLATAVFATAAGAAINSTYQPLSWTKPAYDYAPSIVKDGTGWTMFHCGFDPATNADSIFRSTSTDAKSWSTPVPVFTIGAEGTWDERHVCDPTVLSGVNVGGYTWAMWYTGVPDRPGYPGPNNIGLALSNDGVNWVRHSANPVVYCGDDASVWGCGQPSVVVDTNGTFHMSHTSFLCNDEPCRLNRVRTSTDGLNWVAGATFSMPQWSVGPDFVLGKDGKWYSVIGGNTVCGAQPGTIASELLVHRADDMVGRNRTQVGCIAYTDTAGTGRFVTEQGFYRDGRGQEGTQPTANELWLGFGLASDLIHGWTEDIEAAKVALAVAPSISGVSVANVTTTGATVKWSTNVPTTGTATVKGVTLSTPSSTTHAATFTGLTPKTTYIATVTATDANGRTVTSTVKFTTKRR